MTFYKKAARFPFTSVRVLGSKARHLNGMAGFVLGVQFQVAFVFCLLVVILVFRNTMLGRKRRYLK